MLHYKNTYYNIQTSQICLHKLSENYFRIQQFNVYKKIAKLSLNSLNTELR